MKTHSTHSTTPADKAQTVFVWDRFIRVFHWLLVSCVILNEWVFNDGKSIHQWSGYLASILVIARIVWGFVGSGEARFAAFFPTPAKITHHIICLTRGERPRSIGHNPLGALMMLVLMALVLSLGITGHLQTTDHFFGEEWLEDLHGLLANALLILAFLHALAALVMSRMEGVNLVRAMFTGYKHFK